MVKRIFVEKKPGFDIEAQVQKIPYMLILGDKELEDGTISVRRRSEGDLGSLTVDEFIARAAEEVRTKKRD